MSFLIFNKSLQPNGVVYSATEEHFSIAGYNLVQRIWESRGYTAPQGWSVSANDLLKQHNTLYDSDNHALVIDFHPTATHRIGLVEIVNIYIYTYGTDSKIEWSPMMLELRSVLYKEGFTNLLPEEKRKIVSSIIPENLEKRIFEFLYLNGTDKHWNWGANGMTNAAFIEEDARKYFLPFFADEQKSISK